MPSSFYLSSFICMHIAQRNNTINWMKDKPSFSSRLNKVEIRQFWFLELSARNNDKTKLVLLRIERLGEGERKWRRKRERENEGGRNNKRESPTENKLQQTHSIPCIKYKLKLWPVFIWCLQRDHALSYKILINTFWTMPWNAHMKRNRTTLNKPIQWKYFHLSSLSCWLAFNIPIGVRAIEKYENLRKNGDTQRRREIERAKIKWKQE